MALRILVVEDEMTIALLMEDMLAELGHDVTALAMRLPQAIDLARTAEIDFAVLDVNLDGLMSFPVADALRARRVPFVFVTGYGSAGLEPPYDAWRVLKKPFDKAGLQQAIQAAGA